MSAWTIGKTWKLAEGATKRRCLCSSSSRSKPGTSTSPRGAAQAGLVWDRRVLAT